MSEESDDPTKPVAFAVATADGGEVTFRGKMVALDEQRAARQFITYRHPGGERQPALRVDVIVDDDGVPWCVSATLTGEPGARRVRSADVKTVAGQLEALVDGMVAAAMFVANDQGSGWVKTRHTGRQALPTIRRARKRQRRKTIDLDKVAEVYKDTGPSARTAAVRSAFNVSNRTATRYIQLAREAGLLARTTRGKATDRWASAHPAKATSASVPTAAGKPACLMSTRSPADGGPRRSTGATAEAVRAKLDKARDRVKVEAPVQDSTVRLSDWVEHWSTTHAGSVAAERVDQTAVPVAGAQAPDTGSVWRHPARQAA